MVCLMTGLAAETLHTWSDVDLTHGTLMVRRAIKRVQLRSESGPEERLEVGATKKRDHLFVHRCSLRCVCDALKKHHARQSAEKLASDCWQNSDDLISPPRSALPSTRPTSPSGSAALH